MSVRLGDALKLLLASGTGKAGIFLLAVLVGISLYVLATYPLDFGTQRWSNPAEWADNPKAAPPAWITLFTREKRVAHTSLRAAAPIEVQQAGSSKVSFYRLPMNFDYAEFPTFLSFSLSSVRFQERPPVVTLSLDRPDGTSVVLYQHVPSGARPGEEPPIARYQETPLRVLLSSEATVVANLAQLHNQEYGTSFSVQDLRNRADQAAFGIPSEAPGGKPFDVLTGRYEFTVRVVASNPEDEVDSVKVVVGGSVFGFMGTDTLGRDLAVGLLFGFPVALFIGLLASTLTTTIGTTLGIISGYMGGWVDAVIQRLSDVVANIPLLPILIFMVFVFGSNLFLIILLLVVFSWPGLTILIRSMVLQLRTGQFVEASRALGASRARIMFRHIFPQTAPFVFAQMIFFVPAAILAEAGLSFLGLGDPSIPTWGQILEQGFRTGAVYVGYWWWVLPPGLLIVFTAVTFALLALGLEPVVNPRLRGMR